MYEVHFTQDEHGTPGVIGRRFVDGMFGLGYLHGRYRPLQTILIQKAGQGTLAKDLAPLHPLIHIDRLSRRFDLCRIAKREAKSLEKMARQRIEAYIDGVHAGLEKGGHGFEIAILMADVEQLSVESVIASFLLASFMGLAESQGRMELAIVKALQEGADPEILNQIFGPHLQGWDVEWLKTLAIPNLFTESRPTVSGSNAWAVSGHWTRSGSPLLAGDPHLQINQLPSLFLEVRLSVGSDYWLGATVPGLPGLGMGRNKNCSWSGTFAVADNSDFCEFDSKAASARSVIVERRFSEPFVDVVNEDSFGVSDGLTGPDLSQRWSGREGAANALSAYIELLESKTVAEAKSCLERVTNFSLHYVLADVHGDIDYVQTGRIPRRPSNWSGLYPVRGMLDKGECFQGPELSVEKEVNGIIVSANEARLGPEGAILSTLPQPHYRRSRIQQLLQEHTEHSVHSFMKIQKDVVCLRELRVRTLLIEHMEDGFLRRVLQMWDGQCGPQDEGMTVFNAVLACAHRAFAPSLGGRWFLEALESTELPVWWCEALDRLIAEPKNWTESTIQGFRKELSNITDLDLGPWGDAQTVEFRHMIFGDLPRFLGFNRGPFPLPGAVSTVSQGNVFEVNGGQIAIGPAYRFISPMDEDCIYSSLPGGISGSRFSSHYTKWLPDYLSGQYHILRPPTRNETMQQ
ncbi:MAG: penicillin acylase family protein [Myxococcota bacterium]|nr:penicillin acylase family protein [Myxococcota bacterium]